MVAMALTVSAMMVMMMSRSVLTVGCWGGEGGKGGRGGECGRGGGCSGRGDRFVGVLQVVEEDLVSWRSRACLWGWYAGGVEVLRRVWSRWCGCGPDVLWTWCGGGAEAVWNW